MNPVVLCILLLQVGSIFGQYPNTDTSHCYPHFTYLGQSASPCINPLSASSTFKNINPNKHEWCMIGNSSDYSGFWRYCADMRHTDWQCEPGTSYETVQGGSCKACPRDHTVGSGNGALLYDITHITGCDNLPPFKTSGCPSEYHALSSQHSGCKNPSPNWDCTHSWELSAQEKEAIVALHNIFRIQTGEYPALHMQMISWDDDLAFLAGQHAMQCSFSHDDPNMRIIPEYYYPTGQNIAMSTSCMAHSWLEQFGTMFKAERNFFKYGVGHNPLFPNKENYHYTQLMKDDVTHMGCAKTTCGYPDRYEQFWVCNYNIMQAGDDGVHPWEVAPSYDYSESGAGCKHLVNGNDYMAQWEGIIDPKWYDYYSGPKGNLCDSKGKRCKNGGVLVDATNKCDCDNLPTGFYNGDHCQSLVAQKEVQVSSGGTCFFPFQFNGETHNSCACDEQGCWCPSVADPMAVMQNAELTGEFVNFFVDCQVGEGHSDTYFEEDAAEED